MLPRLRLLAVLALGLSLGGCIAFETPGNAYGLGGTQAYMAQRGPMPGSSKATEATADAQNEDRCTAPAPPPPANAALQEEPLSPGDLVRVDVDGGAPPTGTYKVDTNGALSLLGTDDLPVAGLTIQEAQDDLDNLLVKDQLFRAGFAHADLRILQRGAAQVVVTGAVFQPGPVTINQPGAGIDAVQETAIGDYALGRSLSDALSHAGGVRPDADLSRITLVHDGQTEAINLTGVLTGEPYADPMLANGDMVRVPSRHCFQMELARPTPITPPGVKIFISNETEPVHSNSAAGINAETTSFAYGTRLLQVLVSANCVGGTQITNADRYAVLITSNPETGASEVLQRQIEGLVRRADRDAYNPVIMPGDAVACYDSGVQNVRDVLDSLTTPAVAAATIAVLVK